MSAAETAALPHSDWSSHLANLRSRLLDQFIVLVGLALCVSQALAIYKATLIGVHWSLAVSLPSTGAVWLLFFLRRRVHYHWRARLFLITAWVITLASIANLGPVANSKGFLVLLPLEAMLFLGQRAGWCNVAGVGLTLAAIGTASVQGWIVYQLEYDAYVRLPVVWVQSAFGYTVYSGIGALIAHRLLSSLSAVAGDLEAKANALSDAQVQLRAALHAAEVANQAKGQFVAMVSHELRTPLHALLGFAEVLDASGVCVERQADLLAGIRRNGRDLLDLVNEILDLTRGEAGQLRVQPRPCALRPVLERGLAQVRRQADAKALELGLCLDPELPERVLIDPDRLAQVLTNLLHNAVKFTADGQVQLSADALPTPGDPSRCTLRLAVTDSGLGIAPEDQERIFQPFEQAGGAAHRRRGVGLGLSICRELVGAMGGQIGLSSSPGTGSRFELQFPGVPVVSRATPSTATDGDTSEEYPSDRSETAPAVRDKAHPDQLPPALMALLSGASAARWRALDPATDPAGVAAFAATVAGLAQAHRSRPLADWAARLMGGGQEEELQRAWAEFADFVLEPPPPAALEELRTLAELGLTSRIEDWCADWAGRDQRYAGFARQVLVLAYTFDPDRLCALVDAFLAPGPPPAA